MAANDDRPDILFCMADDWGWPHAGAYGDKGIRTPSFDRIAAEGIRFEHVYVSSPSCTPSRNALITGKYHWQLGPGANLHSTLPVEHESFVHLLRDNGYITGQSPAKTWGPGKVKSWADHHGDHPATETYKTFEEFLEKPEASTQPFFFWLATGDPHRPYKSESGVADGVDLAKVHLFPHFPDAPVVRSDVADYYFEVQRWDRMVGNAIAQLEKRDRLNNTIIIMTGDHGMPFPRCKSNIYDSGMRVPFAMRWGSRIKPGRTVADFISMVDVAPTLLQVAGVRPQRSMTGRSFAPLLFEEKSGRLDPEGRPDVVFGKERHVPSQEKPDRGGYPCRGLRTAEFLMIHNFTPDRWPAGSPNFKLTNYPRQWFADCDAGPTKTYIYINRERDDQHRRAFELCFGKRPEFELYDLQKDPGQINNVAGFPGYAKQLAALTIRLEERLKSTGDPRATDPGYQGFDVHPYLGGGGGKVPREVLNERQEK